MKFEWREFISFQETDTLILLLLYDYTLYANTSILNADNLTLYADTLSLYADTSSSYDTLSLHADIVTFYADITFNQSILKIIESANIKLYETSGTLDVLSALSARLCYTAALKFVISIFNN